MFLSCGDALFDVFAEPDADVSRIGLNAVVGGSPLNVALGLARLGHATGFFTKVSSDLFGTRLRAFMEREAIGQQFLIPTDRNTTLAVVALSKAGSATVSNRSTGRSSKTCTCPRGQRIVNFLIAVSFPKPKWTSAGSLAVMPRSVKS